MVQQVGAWCTTWMLLRACMHAMRRTQSLPPPHLSVGVGACQRQRLQHRDGEAAAEGLGAALMLLQRGQERGAGIAQVLGVLAPSPGLLLNAAHSALNEDLERLVCGGRCCCHLCLLLVKRKLRGWINYRWQRSSRRLHAKWGTQIHDCIFTFMRQISDREADSTCGRSSERGRTSGLRLRQPYQNTIPSVTTKCAIPVDDARRKK